MLTEMHRLMVVAATAALALSIVNAAGARPDLLEEGEGPAVVTSLPDGYQPQLRQEVGAAHVRERPDGYQPQLHLDPIPFEEETGGVDGRMLALLAGLGIALTASAGAAVAFRSRHRVAHL